MANLNVPDNGKLKYVIFAFISLNQPIAQNNLSGVDLSKPWGGSDSFFEKKYFCMKNDGVTLLPYASFANISDNIDMMISRYNPRMTSVKPDSSGKLSSSIAEFWYDNRLPDDGKTQKSTWASLDETNQKSITSKVTSSINTFNTVSRNI